MALVSAEYVRTNWIGCDPSKDSVITALILNAQGQCGSIVHQPVTAKTLYHYFNGNGQQRLQCPYTLKPVLQSMHSRAGVGYGYSTVITSSLIGGAYESANGFDRSTDYMATLTVGFADRGVASTSADFDGSGTYDDILTTICQMTTLLFLNTPHSTDGIRRFALDKVTESVGGAVNRSYEFADLMPQWKRTLQRFRMMPTF